MYQLMLQHGHRETLVKVYQVDMQDLEDISWCTRVCVYIYMHARASSTYLTGLWKTLNAFGNKTWDSEYASS